MNSNTIPALENNDRESSSQEDWAGEIGADGGPLLSPVMMERIQQLAVQSNLLIQEMKNQLAEIKQTLLRMDYSLEEMQVQSEQQRQYVRELCRELKSKDGATSRSGDTFSAL